MKKTYSAKPNEVGGNWWVVDASGKTLGKLATKIADILRGKNKPTFTPHVDTGDFVIVVNAEKVHLTGKKWEQKNYYDYSGYFGGLKVTPAWRMREKHPERIIKDAVKGMLPKNKLSNHIISKLKVYAGPNHPHQAQKPKPLEL